MASGLAFSSMYTSLCCCLTEMGVPSWLMVSSEEMVSVSNVLELRSKS